MSVRRERIAEQLRAEIAQVLRRHATDPRLQMVTLTRVDVAPDLSHAIVFWSTVSLDRQIDPEVVEEGLEGAAAFIRRHLSHSLPLRRMPELRFRYDPSLELGDQTLAVLRSIRGGGGHGPEENS